MVDVRSSVGVSGFFADTEIDHKSAYQRMVITKDMLIKFRRDINLTNTRDVDGRLRQLYEDLDFIAKEIIKEEYKKLDI